MKSRKIYCAKWLAEAQGKNNGDKKQVTLGEDVAEIFKGNIFRIFASKIGGFNIIRHQTLHFILQRVFCGPAEMNTCC